MDPFSQVVSCFYYLIASWTKPTKSKLCKWKSTTLPPLTRDQDNLNWYSKILAPDWSVVCWSVASHIESMELKRKEERLKIESKLDEKS